MHYRKKSLKKWIPYQSKETARQKVFLPQAESLVRSFSISKACSENRKDMAVLKASIASVKVFKGLFAHLRLVVH